MAITNYQTLKLTDPNAVAMPSGAPPVLDALRKPKEAIMTNQQNAHEDPRAEKAQQAFEAFMTSRSRKLAREKDQLDVQRRREELARQAAITEQEARVRAEKEKEEESNPLLELLLEGAVGAAAGNISADADVDADAAKTNNGFKDRKHGSKADSLQFSKIVNRARKMARLEKMAKEGNFIKRVYAKTRLAMMRPQATVAAKIGEIVARPFVALKDKATNLAASSWEKITGAGEKTLAVAEDAAKIIGEDAGKAAELAKPAATIGSKIVKVGARVAEIADKLAKPAIKIGRFIAWTGGLIGIGVGVVAASPVVATAAVVTGTVVTVGMAAGALVSAYSKYRETNSYKEAIIAGGNEYIPIQSARDVLNGDLPQAAGDLAEYAVGTGSSTAMRITQQGMNAIHYGQKAQTALAVAEKVPAVVETGMAVAQLAQANPEAAKFVAQVAGEAAKGGFDHLAPLADSTAILVGDALNAKGDKLAALAHSIENHPEMEQAVVDSALKQAPKAAAMITPNSIAQVAKLETMVAETPAVAPLVIKGMGRLGGLRGEQASAPVPAASSKKPELEEAAVPSFTPIL